MSRIEQIERMLASEPDDVFLNFSLAMELVKASRHEEALSQFGRVAGLDPNYVPAYFQQANALIALQRNEEAKHVLQQGVAVAERVGDPHAASQMNQMLSLLR